MKKIPTLFEREFENHKVVKITNKVTSGFEWVLNGEGTATVKYDGSCCAFIDGKFYKRYDAKHGKKPPEGAIPCCAPDPVTGHHPHWVEVNENDPRDVWFIEAKNNTKHISANATYEAVGAHFNGNPYHLNKDYLMRHGIEVANMERTFEGIKRYLETHYVEGIVFWKDNEPQCKIKRSDFGLQWGNKGDSNG